jgi:hypothetical protein
METGAAESASSRVAPGSHFQFAKERGPVAQPAITAAALREPLTVLSRRLREIRHAMQAALGTDLASSIRTPAGDWRQN